MPQWWFTLHLPLLSSNAPPQRSWMLVCWGEIAGLLVQAGDLPLETLCLPLVLPHCPLSPWLLLRRDPCQGRPPAYQNGDLVNWDEHGILQRFANQHKCWDAVAPGKRVSALRARTEAARDSGWASKSPASVPRQLKTDRLTRLLWKSDDPFLLDDTRLVFLPSRKFYHRTCYGAYSSLFFFFNEASAPGVTVKNSVAELKKRMNCSKGQL